MNNVTHKITYLEMWIYFLFFNSEHSQIYMSACYFIPYFLSDAVRIYLENFEKEIFLLNIYTRNELHVYVFALPFK